MLQIEWTSQDMKSEKVPAAKLDRSLAAQEARCFPMKEKATSSWLPQAALAVKFQQQFR